MARKKTTKRLRRSSGSPRFIAYWSAFKDLGAAAITAQWGLRGLFISRGSNNAGECVNPFDRKGPNEWEKALAAYRGELDTTLSERPDDKLQIDSAQKLRSLCRFAIKDLNTIAKWKGWFDNPPTQDFWGDGCPHPDFRPDEFIQEIWSIMRALPGPDPPPQPHLPISVNEAVSVLDSVIAWCGPAESKTEKEKNRIPENPDVLRLAKEMKRKLRKTGFPTKKSIALEFTNGNESRAQNLLRQLRSFPHLLEAEK
jgi:hypothetical protein